MTPLTANTKRKKNLRRLTLSQMDLGSDDLVDLVIRVLMCQKQPLQLVDLSHARLCAHHLVRISDELQANPYVTKSLNLSYNTMPSFQGDLRGKALVLAFMKNMQGYLALADNLNHINLSGMGLLNVGDHALYEEFIDLCFHLGSCVCLQCIHLSDNCIGTNVREREKAEIMELFGVDHQVVE